MKNNLIIRNVNLNDAERLAEIYSYYVKNTAVSFECKAPDAGEFKKRITDITAKFPYIVCECNGKVSGYAYASAYSSREAYNWTVASSIYVDKECRKLGIGSALYTELEKRLKEQGIVNILAGVAFAQNEDEYITHDSYKFHMKLGYEKVAQLKKVGKKFDRWYDILWMQKVL